MQVKTWSATTGLRIVKPIPDFSFIAGMNDDRLQQAWQCHETGEIEWRSVRCTEMLGFAWHRNSLTYD